jgi:hypothetical protein
MSRLLVVALMLTASCYAQSLGDVAKQSREQPKKKAAKTITNEDLPSEKKTASTSSGAGDQERELEHMKRVMEDICADPKTNHGRTLSDYDKQMMEDGVKPLRVWVDEQKRWHKEAKAALDELELETEKATAAATPKNRPMNDEDMAKFKAIQADYEAKRAALLKQTEDQQKAWAAFNRRLEEIGQACPEAAKTVPD